MNPLFVGCAVALTFVSSFSAMHAAESPQATLGATPQARDSGTSVNVIRFFGRWDLRAPDRAITVNSGSYFLAQFSGTQITARFDVSQNQPGFPTIAWRIDQGDWQEAEVAPTMMLADGLTDAPHTLWLMVRALDTNQSRWKAPLVASVTFLGLNLPGGGKFLPPLPEWNSPKLKIEFLGDSITEGYRVRGPHLEGKTGLPWANNALLSYSCQTAMQLGAQWRQVGFGATGLSGGGSGGTVSALKSFNYFYDGCPRDNWQPDLVVVNQGTNDRTILSGPFEVLYSRYLTLIRQAYPNAKIVALKPFNGAHADGIQKAVDDARAAGDKKVYFIDTTAWFPAGLHPSFREGPGIATHLVRALQTQVFMSRDLSPAVSN